MTDLHLTRSTTDLGEYLELLPALVEVDESVGRVVGDAGVDVHEIGEERAQVRDGPVVHLWTRTQMTATQSVAERGHTEFLYIYGIG